MKRPEVLILVRHGENIENGLLHNSDLLLSEEGVRQAAWARDMVSMACNGLDVVISSTSKRAIQTAEIICAERFGGEIINDEGLLEAGYGNRPGDVALETEEESRLRANEVLCRVFAEYCGKVVLLAAHGRLIAMMERIVDGMNARRTIENCAITIYSGWKTGGGFLYKEMMKPYDRRSERIYLGVNVYFVRHGESESNRDGILAGGMEFPLTETGLEQAKILAKRLDKSGVGFDKIYSSPLSRARRTAEVIARECGIVEIEGCAELAGCGGGDLEGRPYEEWYAVPPEELVCVHGVESYEEQFARVGRMIRRLICEHKKGDNVLVVSHASVYQVFYAAVVGICDEKATFDIQKPRVADFCTLII